MLRQRFTDRVDAGRQLATALVAYRGRDPVVLGLPRGGVPVAREVASLLGAPLDVIVVRKLGLPGHEELGMGAIGEDGVVVFNDEVLRGADVTQGEIDAEIDRELQLLGERVIRIRARHAPVPVRGRLVIIVDDGLATGITARAACRVARARGASEVVLAVPVAAADWRSRLRGEADAFVSVTDATDFSAVGQFYDDFAATDDAEVLRCLG